MREREFTSIETESRIHCKAFEDNYGALELSRAPKMRPRTKHINIVYHNFRSFVRYRLVSIHLIVTKEQTGDILKKLPNHNLFQIHRKAKMRW